MEVVQMEFLVFSTHVEVILIKPDQRLLSSSILHTCGGDPIFRTFSVKVKTYSPHMWR